MLRAFIVIQLYTTNLVGMIKTIRNKRSVFKRLIPISFCDSFVVNTDIGYSCYFIFISRNCANYIPSGLCF